MYLSENGQIIGDFKAGCYWDDTNTVPVARWSGRGLALEVGSRAYLALQLEDRGSVAGLEEHARRSTAVEH